MLLVVVRLIVDINFLYRFYEIRTQLPWRQLEMKDAQFSVPCRPNVNVSLRDYD